MSHVVIVSSCLMGLATRYDGRSYDLSDALRTQLGDAVPVPVCSEQLGGLPTPRPRNHLTGGDGADVLAGKAQVINELATDVTEQFISGAEQVLHICQIVGATKAFLKSRSPSCGCGHIYRDGQLVAGVGVTSALLMDNGVEVIAV